MMSVQNMEMKTAMKEKHQVGKGELCGEAIEKMATGMDENDMKQKIKQLFGDCFEKSFEIRMLIENVLKINRDTF